MTLRTSRTGTHSGPIPPAAQPAALSPLHLHTARVWRAVAGRLSKSVEGWLCAQRAARSNAYYTPS